MTLLESHDTVRVASNGSNSWWTVERIADLTRMWVTEEMSSGEIAAELGITRSAVLGKIDRLGINGRECDMENRSKGAEMREARNRLKAARLAEKAARPPRAAAMVEVVPEIPAVAPCALIDLDDSKCHWPFGEPQSQDFHFCGGPAKGPYCGAHRTIAYRSHG